MWSKMDQRRIKEWIRSGHLLPERSTDGARNFTCRQSLSEVHLKSHKYLLIRRNADVKHCQQQFRHAEHGHILLLLVDKCEVADRRKDPGSEMVDENAHVHSVKDDLFDICRYGYIRPT